MVKVPSQPSGSGSTVEEITQGLKQVMLEEEEYLSPGRSPDRAEGAGDARDQEATTTLGPSHITTQTNISSRKTSP